MIIIGFQYLAFVIADNFQFPAIVVFVADRMARRVRDARYTDQWFVSVGSNDKILLLVISQLSLDIRRQRFGVGSSDTISEQNIVRRIFDLGDDMSSIVSPKIASRLTVFIGYLTRIAVCIVMTVYTIGSIFNIRMSYSQCPFPNFRRSVMILCITLLFVINFHRRNHISLIGFNDLRRISRYTI